MNDNRPYILAILLASLAIVLFHGLAVAAGFPLYRDIHLGAALHYYEHDVDLLRPMIVAFNLNENPTPQELPYWQAACGLLFKLFGPIYGIATVLSLCLFFTTIFPFYKLLRHHFSLTPTLIILLCWLTQPITVLYAGMGSPDGLALVSMVWFVYCIHRMLDGSRTAIWWMASFCTGVICATTKLPFFFSAGLFCIGLLVLYHQKSLRAWMLVASVGATTGLVFLLWIQWTGHVLSQSEYPAVDLRVFGNPEMVRWFFGDWNYRLDPANWIRGAWRAGHMLLGNFFLVSVLVWGAIHRQARFALLWLIAAIATNLIFASVILRHQNYFLIYSPPLAVMLGYGISDLIKRIQTERSRLRWMTTGVLFAGLLGATAQGLMGGEIVAKFDPFPAKMAAVIKEHTKANEKLAIAGGGFGGHLFILSGRRGVNAGNHLNDPAFIARLKDLGYTKMILVSESPVLDAAQRNNPGQAARERQTYAREWDLSLLEGWETLLENDDIKILEIPPSP